MKKIIYLAVFFASIALTAQDNNKNDGITLGAYIPAQAESIPTSSKQMLLNKLGQVITKNGISGGFSNSRFVITPNITVLSKDIMPSAPPKVALNLELTLYLGDGIAGNLFASESLELKGIGTNETKAYMSAIKRLNPKNKAVQNFITEGKTKIIEYYNNNCSLILKKASTLENGRLEEALMLLTSVPEASTCFNKVKSKIRILYQRLIDRDCKQKLREASAIWAANQNINAANDAAALLSSIEPEAKCNAQVKSLFSKISKRVKELSDRDWNYQLKVLDVSKQYIKAARDVGVAYGKGQPSTVNYNVRGWY